MLGVSLAACKGQSHLEAYRPTPTTLAPTTTTAPAPVPDGVPAPTKIALLAQATGAVVHLHPGPGDASVSKMLPNPTIEGMPLAMLVVDRQGDWLQVRFPERPNGSLAWITADEVTLSPVDNRIVISITNRNLRVLDKAQQVVYETNVAVGKPRTPTPTGRFYVDIWLPNPGHPYGTFMLSIAGFSDVLKSFGGGRGQIAMHGWSDTSVMGQAASNGCIRMRNGDISRVAQLAPLGTPVEIVA
jgi:lipoprotein-anchoring transpeptidase ErfK/SrfK